MPQATDELRAKFPGWEPEASDHLYSRGFKMTPDFSWIMPEGHEMSERDWDAIDYLFFEWDFGGIINYPVEADAKTESP